MNYALIATGVWIWTGLSMTVLSAAYKSIDTQILEAARVDGANPWKTFWRISLPMLAQPISFVAITMIINSLKMIDLVLVMTAGGPAGASRVIGFSFYWEVFNNNLVGYGSAVAILMLIPLAPLMASRSGGSAARRAGNDKQSFRGAARPGRVVRSILVSCPRPRVAGPDASGCCHLAAPAGRHRRQRMVAGRGAARISPLDNYAACSRRATFSCNFVNSFIITIPSTVLPIIDRRARRLLRSPGCDFRGRNLVFMIIVALLVLPLQETWVPVLSMQSRLGLTGHFLALWLAHTAYGLPFAIFLLRNFFGSFRASSSRPQSSTADSEYGIFRSIVLPLSVPALASLGIFQFVWVWNDLMNALVLLQDLNKFPLTVAIQSLLGSYGSEWNLLASGAFISMSIPLLVFFLLQRYFVQGITAGAVKG